MASAAFDLVSLKRSGKRAIEGITSNKNSIFYMMESLNLISQPLVGFLNLVVLLF